MGSNHSVYRQYQVNMLCCVTGCWDNPPRWSVKADIPHVVDHGVSEALTPQARLYFRDTRGWQTEASWRVPSPDLRRDGTDPELLDE